ncbi:MAG: 30S ribosomal protein S4 [Planctomycetales bacterium]
MARYTGPVCRLCRREGLKLFLKGSRCDTKKCAFERRDSPPGMHFRRGKMTDYAVHLREKQKVKQYYGVLEKQFRNYFSRAERAKQNTGDVLMSLLERRLDNVVYRLGFAHSRSHARQLVAHGHIIVNGGRVDVPSYCLKIGDVIYAKDRPKSLQAVQTGLEMSGRDVPEFLNLTTDPKPEGQMARLPGSEDVSVPVNTQLIIELCSK